MGTIKFIFCESWCQSRVCFKSTFTYVWDGSLIELLYADNLVLCGESFNEVMDKYGRLKNAVEGKVLRVNVDKTKGMQLLFGKKGSVLKVDRCGVCGEQVSCNCVQCTKCQRWDHRHCSDVPS